MGTEQPLVGQRLDALGLTAEINDEDLLSDALVIMKFVLPDGSTYSHMAWSDGLDIFHRLGLLDAAQVQTRLDIAEGRTGDEE